MSHFKEFQSDANTSDGRALGDEWMDWDGSGGGTVQEGNSLFLFASAAIIVITDILLCLFTYLITPRLSGWHSWLPMAAWIFTIVIIVLTAVWFLLLSSTVASGRNLFPGKAFAFSFFGFIFSQVFRLAGFVGISRDRMGHSFVRVSNALSRSLKPSGRKEKLLILLPRCLSKEELKGINDLKEIYPLDVHTVSGGELARKKVRELRPTAVIGVACERDLVSGIRDVGQRISVIGIPNTRPDGPCKNTHVDMTELIEAIEFYVGPPKTSKLP